MGSDNSKPASNQPPPELQSWPPGGLVVLGTDFVFGGSKPVTLRLKEDWWNGHTHAVREVNTEEVCFQTEGRRGAAGTLRQVYTRNATPAFGMKKVETSATQGSETFYHPNGEQLSRIFVSAGATQAVVRARVNNLARGGEPFVLTYEFSYSRKSGVIYISEPERQKDHKVPIALVAYRMPGIEKLKGDYFLTFSPGMDASILMAMCISLDEARRAVRGL
eukprot:jgi/Tetstr1/424348/TSEL_014911.t1